MCGIMASGRVRSELIEKGRCEARNESLAEGMGMAGHSQVPCGSWEPRDDTQVRSLKIFCDKSVSELRCENLQKMPV